MRNLLIAICCLLLMTFAGCHSKAKKIDACALLTKSEIQTALGGPVAEPEKTRETASISECRYTATNSPSRSVVVNVLQPDFTEQNVSSPAAKLFSDEMTRAVRSGSAQHLAGIGDDAFWDGLKLHVLQGRTYFYVSSGSDEGPNAPETAQRLAQIIVLRL